MFRYRLTLILIGLAIGFALGLAIGSSLATEDALRDYERAQRVHGITFEPAASRYPAALDKLCPAQPAAMTRSRCAQWVLVAQCETGGQQRYLTPGTVAQVRWRYNGSSGYDGALQFSTTTWTSNVHRIPSIKLTRYQRIQRRAGAYHHAWSAPPAVQILAAEVLRIRIGGEPQQSAGWPNCGAWF